MTDDRWEKVRDIMWRAIRGKPVSAEEIVLLSSLWKEDAARYSEIRKEEKDQATREVNPFR